MRPNPVRVRWTSGRAASNLWIDIASPVTVERLGRCGYDSYTIDLQHSLIDRGTVVPLLQALSLGGGAPLVRVSRNDPAEIGFVLDAGAYGVICPTIESADACARFVDACRYPPQGSRSWGPTRGLLYGGDDYFAASSETVLCIALVETRAGVDAVDAIAATPGLDMVYLGPNDLGVSHGAAPSMTPAHPAVFAAMDTVVAAARRHGIAAGMHTATTAVARDALARGFTFVSLGYATSMLEQAATAVLSDAFDRS